MDTKRFQLILQTDVFEEWRRFYPGHGVRQDLLRKVVKIMIYRAKLRSGEPIKRPYWMPRECDSKNLGAAIAALIEQEEINDGNH